jgi:hypothetical protein
MALHLKIKKQMGVVNEHTHRANVATIKLNHLWRQMLECASCDPDFESEDELAAQEDFLVVGGFSRVLRL